MVALGVPCLVGFVASWLMTLCWAAIADRRRWAAAAYEAAALAVSIVAWQLWADSGNDWRILAAEAMGTVVGTWLAIRP